MPVCAFCGSPDLTREHVLAEWFQDVGLSRERMLHTAGWHNAVPREMGTRPPFEQKVREVCGPCNHGWMSGLEGAVKWVLAPMVRGERVHITAAEQKLIAAWAHKTALVSVLVSSDVQREQGYGVPPSEFREMYARREAGEPLLRTRFWVARRGDSARFSSIVITPMVVRTARAHDDLPDAYAMTIAVGAVVLQGMRFTGRPEVPLSTRQGFASIWPVEGDVQWPTGAMVDDREYLSVAMGENLVAVDPRVQIEAWNRAVDLDVSTDAGSDIRLPLPCVDPFAADRADHFGYYPKALAQMAMRGTFLLFIVECACRQAYVVETKATRVGVRIPGFAIHEAAAVFDALPGERLVIAGRSCKPVTTPSE